MEEIVCGEGEEEERDITFQAFFQRMNIDYWNVVPPKKSQLQFNASEEKNGSLRGPFFYKGIQKSPENKVKKEKFHGNILFGDIGPSKKK